MQLTVGGHRLSEWRTNAENDAGENILVAGDEEKSSVLRIVDARLVYTFFGRLVPVGQLDRPCHPTQVNLTMIASGQD